MERPNESLEGLKSLLLRYKHINLAIIAAISLAAVAVLTAIILRGPIQRSLDPSRKCLSCHKPRSAKYIHEPYKKGQCLSCHTSHKKGEKSKLKSSVQKLCFTCHGLIGKEIGLNFSHEPAKKGRCLECHKNHVSKHADLLKSDSKDICIRCHPIDKELAKSDKHQPFERKQCLSCHVAHGSAFDKGLRDSQKELCILCHINIAEATAKDFQHLPFEDGNCTDCHGAHATDYDSQLLAQAPGLCYDCHPEVEPYFQKASHHPSQEGTFTCSNCHNSHAEKYRYLLAAEGKNFCFTCHGDKKNLYLTCAHNEILGVGGTGDCRSCHVTHGADYSGLLPNDSISICFNCHLQMKDKTHNHPVADGLTDALVNKTLTCTSSCHNPHGTGKSFMVTWYSDELCLKCHSKEELP